MMLIANHWDLRGEWRLVFGDCEQPFMECLLLKHIDNFKEGIKRQHTPNLYRYICSLLSKLGFYCYQEIPWRQRHTFFFSNFLLGIYFTYISNAILKVLYTLPLPSPNHPLPLLGPGVSLVLGHIKFVKPRGLSSQWWSTRPTSATNAARDTSSGGYSLVHIVVPPIGLQTPAAPWVLSLAPPLGALGYVSCMLKNNR